MLKKKHLILPLLCLAAVFGLVIGLRQVQRAVYPMRYTSMIEEQSAAYGVDEALIYAVVYCESGFHPDAVSSVGARGLMQLTEETFDWVGWRLGEETTFDDAFDPQTNLRYGVYLLSYLLELFEDEETALAAYHAGAGIVQRWLSDERYSADGRTLTEIPYADTAQYVPRVIQAKKTYQHLYGKGL